MINKLVWKKDFCRIPVNVLKADLNSIAPMTRFWQIYDRVEQDRGRLAPLGTRDLSKRTPQNIDQVSRFRVIRFRVIGTHVDDSSIQLHIATVWVKLSMLPQHSFGQRQHSVHQLLRLLFCVHGGRFPVSAIAPRSYSFGSLGSPPRSRVIIPSPTFGHPDPKEPLGG